MYDASHHWSGILDPQCKGPIFCQKGPGIHETIEKGVPKLYVYLDTFDPPTHPPTQRKENSGKNLSKVIN